MSHLQTNYKLVLKDSALDHFASDIHIVATTFTLQFVFPNFLALKRFKEGPC